MICSIIYQQLTSTGRLCVSGDEFRMWKSKIKFVLSELGVSYVLTDPIPAEPLEHSPKEEKERYEKWIKDDFTCRHAMLFAMVDPIFFKFEGHQTAMEMMDAIDNLFLNSGKEREDHEWLHMVGVKDMAKILLMEDPASKERKLDEMKRDQGVTRACEAINKVRAEVNKLAKKVTVLESSVRNGTKVVEKEFNVLTELLMVQLLNLDGIEAEGEAKVQRRIEVRRVQNLVETLDSLKAGKTPQCCNCVSQMGNI